jgi:glutamate-1-semialdehyde 2,1-aminomutase
MQPDYSRTLAALAAEYERRAPTSAALNRRALQSMVDGGSHALRLIRPFPPRIAHAQGAWVWDEDGNAILDFWQGHHANLLGHNPRVVTEALAEAFREGRGLQTGFTDRTQVEVAELICRRTGAERVRFTTSGALATMYAILLARAYTGREVVLKVGGGWHGANPWGLVGAHYEEGATPWMVESEGLPAGLTGEVAITRFNDADRLADDFRRMGDRIACFIVEPFVGAGGFIFAHPEYLRAARALCDRYGAVLIFDEVISGFRFGPSDLGSLYGVRPDLSTFAKIIGGGMPVAAVAGRAAIMALCGREGGRRVAFSGGTYSAHPAAMLAAKAHMEHITAHADEIYPHIARLGAQMRAAIERAFAAEGIFARCTGGGEALGIGSSVAVPHFPYRDDLVLSDPDTVNDPALTDTALRDGVFQLALLIEGAHVVHGGGSASAAHTEADITEFEEAVRRAARRVKT